MSRPSHALTRHLAVTGFMGAGKTTAGRAVAERIGRRFVDLDHAIEARAGAAVPDLFGARGEAGFRALEEEVAHEVLAGSEPVVVALGGGAVLSERTRTELAGRAFTVLLDVDTRVAWERVRGGSRPLARDAEAFHALHRERQPVYELVADARAHDHDGVLLAAAGVHVERGAIDLLADLVPGSGPVELVADARVNGIHGVRAQVALEERDIATHEVPAGEAAKTTAVLERLWRSFTVGRDGAVVALGGGTTTDVGGFAAAPYKRGVAWTAVPTTLMGQVDA
ncbi:MAG: 3-dehydroquinate synthase, partial [Dehalococcoidia bacterium]|nr:3-dehydroquinate synthase [Dehalococcoidia bacterium]